MPDWSEWRQAAQSTSATPSIPFMHPRFADHLRLVAAKLDHLTDSDAWAAYRAHLTTLIDETEQQIHGLQRVIEELFGEELLRGRLQLARLRGRQDGYREALQVPDVVQGTVAKLTASSSAPAPAAS